MHQWQQRLSFIMITIVLVHGLSFSLLQMTYQFNPDVFEAHCVNKAKPELSCHGKCCLMKMQKQSSGDPSQANTSESNKRIAISFEYTLLMKLESFLTQKSDNLIFYDSYNVSYFETHLSSLDHPPQV